MHPRPLVLWRRGWLLWRLWWTPLLQWVLLNSLTPRMSHPAWCRIPPPTPTFYQLLTYCVKVSVCQSVLRERLLWVMWWRVRVSGVFLCWWCGQAGLLLWAAFLRGDAPQCPQTNSTSPSLYPPGVTEPHFGFCLDCSPCMGMWSCHDYFESCATVVCAPFQSSKATRKNYRKKLKNDRWTHHKGADIESRSK